MHSRNGYARSLHRKQTLRIGLCFSITLVFNLTFTAVLATDEEPRTPKSDAISSTSLSYFANLIDELDSRRRLQFLYPNPQSIFNGVNIGFVQTSTGNLTFERRDLVILGANSITLSRIHDTNLTENKGLGRGWQLNLLETIKLKDGQATYIDGRAAHHIFESNESIMYTLQNPSPSMYGVSLAIIDNFATIRTKDGTILQFNRLGQGPIFNLVRKVTPDGDVTTLHYDKGRLQSVNLDGEPTLNIHWEGDRISKIIDLYGRVIVYKYDELGLLTSVTDVANKEWKYTYNSDGHLSSGIYPNGNQYMTIQYDENGRVTQSSNTKDFSFKYQVDKTIVTEQALYRHEFIQNGEGVTVAYGLDDDVIWQINLDQLNRVINLNHSDLNYSLFYENDKLKHIDHSEGRMIFHYDTRNRLSHINGSVLAEYAPRSIFYTNQNTVEVTKSNSTTKFVWNDMNKLTQYIGEVDTINLQYDAHGTLAQILYNDNQVNFNKDQFGRIMSTSYPRKGTVTYYYDKLGSRNLTVFSNGSRMSLHHDERGNIIHVIDTNSNNVNLMQSYKIDNKNRVTQVDFPKSTRLNINYDDKSRPDEFIIDGHRVLVNYHEDEFSFTLTSSDGKRWVGNETKNSLVYSSLYTNTMYLIYEQELPSFQPNYGFFKITQDLDINLIPPVEHIVPRLEKAVASVNLLKYLFEGDSFYHRFEKPSNAVFQPLEYLSTNCCMSCPFVSQCGQY